MVLLSNVSLKPYSTLRAGGAAEYLGIVRSSDELATVAAVAQVGHIRTTILGGGSNILPSDDGVAGLVLVNRAHEIDISGDGIVTVDTGCPIQDVFLRTAQVGLSGLQFAVGVPGSIGGALVSNAGAYRSSIGELLTELEVVADGKRRWVAPDWLGLSYRDSRLRKDQSLQAVMLRARMKLTRGSARTVFAEARDYQRQRISKQPPSPSAGSFFKNVYNQDLADKLPGLTEGMRKAGVVPAGFLIEACGLKGYRHGGAMFGERHANFILNVGGASAFEIRTLAGVAKKRVEVAFGVKIEEEVLYLGDWSRFQD